MQKNEELKKLKALESAGLLLSEKDQARLRELEQTAGPSAETPIATPAGTPAPSATPTPKEATLTPSSGSPAEEVFIPLNTESFDRGGKQFWPPPEPRIYPAVCGGIMYPDRKEDQCWFIFRNTEDAPSFRGMLVTANLRDKAETSGAWKVKDILDALGVGYRREPGQGVYVESVEGKPCQVEWQYVDLPRGREMRIQNVYPAGQKIEQL